MVTFRQQVFVAGDAALGRSDSSSGDLGIGENTTGRLFGVTPIAPRSERIERALANARSWLLGRQQAQGFWCAELEGDTTLESYMILLEAFAKRSATSDRSAALAHTIRGEVLPAGGWV